MQKSSSQNVFSSFFSSSSKSRPGTSSGDVQIAAQQAQAQLQQQFQQRFGAPSPLQNQNQNQNQSERFPQPQQPPPPRPPPPIPSLSSQGGAPPNVLTKKDRKPPYARKSSFSSPNKASSSTSSLSAKKRSGSSGSTGSYGDGTRSTSAASGVVIVTDRSIPPALPDFALAANNAARRGRGGGDYYESAIASPASTDSFSRLLGRNAPTQTNYSGGLTPMPTRDFYGGRVGGGSGGGESGGVHGNIREISKKRIHTLDYLRKAHEGQVFWFSTYMFEKPDQSRMSAVTLQKLARRATNYLLLGLSLPTIVDANQSTPLEFLRNLNSLLSEFESFQQLHGENGSSGSLSRARLPQMFRRGPGTKSRRSASTQVSEITDGGIIGIGMSAAASASVVSFAGAESELLPGETYTHLLTPALPFDPDFYETFATLCDVLIDCYKRVLTLLPTPRDCTAPIAEQFAKVDSKVRKIIIQGTVKEFEESTRTHVKTEISNISKVVLSNLM